MIKIFTILFPAVIYSLTSIAQEPLPIGAPSNAIETKIPTPEIDVKKPALPPADYSMVQVKSSIEADMKRLSSATLADFKNDKELSEIALNIGMLQGNIDLAKKVLPIYKQFPNTDQILIDYVQGAIYREEGEYKKAISLYRKLIAENPEMIRVRMDLAILLFADHQDIAARDQFIKLRSEPDNDELVKKAIQQYLDAIDKRSAWSFNGGVSYISDDNVNNASSSKIITYGNLVFNKVESSLPQSAHGIDFSLGASKDFNISGSNYLTFDASGFGKVYWDNHEYDDLNFRLASGYRYKDALSNFSLTPFAKLRYVNSKPYSKTLGVSFSASKWFTPSFQLSNFNELAWEKSDEDINKPSDKQFFTSLSALWAPKSTQYFLVNTSLFNVKTNSEATSYFRPGIGVMWNQDWSLGGLSSRVNLNYGKKIYKGVGVFGVKRFDNEYTAGLTLWNRDWHYAGITPKISLKYSKTDSNIDDLYTYDKTSVFLKFDKTF